MEMLILVILITILVLSILYYGIVVVPQSEEWVIERLGKYLRTLKPGLNLIIPFVDTIASKMSTKDFEIDIKPQSMITSDNVVVEVDLIAFVKVTDPARALYGIEDFKKAVEDLILTTTRAIIGGITLNDALNFKTRDKIIDKLKYKIAPTVSAWGVTIRSVDMKDIQPDKDMQDSMKAQAVATINKKAIEAEAEAEKIAIILRAEGELRAAELSAKAQIMLAKSSAESIKVIAETLDGNELPLLYILGEQYIKSLNKMADSQNSKFIVYPADIQSAIQGLFSIKRDGTK